MDSYQSIEIIEEQTFIHLPSICQCTIIFNIGKRYSLPEIFLDPFCLLNNQCRPKFYYLLVISVSILTYLRQFLKFGKISHHENYSKFSTNLLMEILGYFLILIVFPYLSFFLKVLFEYYYVGIWILTYYSQNDKRTASELIYKVYSKKKIYLVLTKILAKSHFNDLCLIVLKKPWNSLKNFPYIFLNMLGRLYRSDCELLGFMIIKGEIHFNEMKESFFVKNQSTNSITLCSILSSIYLLPLIPIACILLHGNWLTMLFAIVSVWNTLDLATKLVSGENLSWEMCIECASLLTTRSEMNLNEKLNRMEEGEVFFR